MFTNTVKAFMRLDDYEIEDQIEILATLIKEPLMKDDAFGEAVSLAHKLRQEKKYFFLSELCYFTGLKIISSYMYNQETVHVMQKEYLDVAYKLLESYKGPFVKVPKKYSSVIKRFPKYKDISLVKLLSIIYSTLHYNKSTAVLLGELKDCTKDTCSVGVFCRLINAILPYTDYKIENKEYEKERLFNIFNKVLSEKSATTLPEIIATLSSFVNISDELKELDCMIVMKILKDYTGLEWGYSDKYYVGNNYT